MIRSPRPVRFGIKAAVAAAVLAGYGATAQADPTDPATAADQPTYQSAQPAEQPVVEVSDEKLEKFASAATEIMEVQQDYAAEMQAAPDASEVQTLQQQAQEEMTGIVDEHGLSVGEYNMIAQRLQTDPELIKRISEMQ